MSGDGIITLPSRRREATQKRESPFAELVAATNFSFLRGAAQPKHMVLTSILLGHSGLGIADRNTVAGVVRAWSALDEIRRNGLPPPDKVREGGSPGEFAYIEDAPPDTAISNEALKAMAAAFRLVVGTRLVFADGTPDIVVYPEDRAAWGRLTRLLSVGKRRAIKGECHLTLPDLLEAAKGLCMIVMPSPRLDDLPDLLATLRKAAQGGVWLAAAMHRRGDDRRRLAKLFRIAEAAGIPLLATNDALYHEPGARDLQDVLSCIREKVTLATAGRLLEANAERHLKTPVEMARLFVDAPETIDETQKLLSRIRFTLDDLRYEYPHEPVPPGWEPQAWLEKITWDYAAERYPKGIPEKVCNLLAEELAIIGRLEYAPYFLTIFDTVFYARSKGILCQGRGSAANSAVCYVLGITSVDPSVRDLLFARFLSEKRREPPDIDVDFEHERREEVIQHVYEKYGRHRAGIIATVIHYRPRSAMREVGKVLGLTEDVTARLASTQWGSWGSKIPDDHIAQTGLDPANPMIRRALDLARRMLGFPRHLSQHVGGFVLSQRRLDELVPIGNAAMEDRTFVEWDKDDVDALGLMKVDILALGMLTCIRKSFDLMRVHDLGDFDLHRADQDEDPVVYDMLCKGDSLGVFQVESRAQMNMLPRLRPRVFYDLVIQVAIVRPGPIQGDMVHPYLKRRAGKEPVSFPAPAPEHGLANELEDVLGRTLGVPLFQEQAMHLAMVAAKFTDDEANGLRKAMATFRNDGTIHLYRDKMVEGMVRRGYERDFAERCFKQIEGFGSYGFPESHAASFGRLVYVSSWIKCHQPAVFACALLNAQPMGFYAPAQIVRDAQEHGVEARAVDVNRSDHDCTLEPREDGALALRLGFRQVDGIGEDAGKAIMDKRGTGYRNVEELARRTKLPARTLRRLADADAMRSMGLDRRAALWAVRRLPDDDPLPLFAAADTRELGEEPEIRLKEMALGEHVAADYQTVRLSLKGHPMQILRPFFDAEDVLTCAATDALKDGRKCRTAGIVLVRQRPGNGNAVFITIEDETGITNIVLWARQFEQMRRPVMAARLMLVEGRVQKSEEGVTHLMAERIVDRTDMLARLSDAHEAKVTLSRADEFLHPQYPRGGHPRNVRVLPRSRDFH